MILSTWACILPGNTLESAWEMYTVFVFLDLGYHS